MVNWTQTLLKNRLDRLGSRRKAIRRCRLVQKESWREGYMFAVEIHRLLRAGLDIVDRIHLMEIACAMQVLRSLGAQTSRITKRETRSHGLVTG